jgi:uracil-DNA glycosylase family 4
MTSNKQKRLDQIAADIVKNNVCPDLAKNASHLVPGEGSPNADVVFIGEAPGKNEDLTGRPFVGAAGKFLDALLAEAGLQRDDVFITSILKYRPPNNRDPRPAEKEEFWPYMVRQLEVIDPLVVVTLGRHSMEYFLPNQKIGQVHGQAVETKLGSKTVVVMPLYHPAAALYNGSMRQTLIDDFVKLAPLLKELKGN